jgi:DNA polymerase sigma
MKAKVKEIDLLRDSVRRERQGFIKLVEEVVKDTFSNKNGNGFVGIKIFGSMATELAIETSDVDLVVTGITSEQISNSDPYSSESTKGIVIAQMQKLFE